MSWARIAQNGAAPPDPQPGQQCAPGEVAGNTECHACWDYYGNEPNSSRPASGGQACECAEGYEWYADLSIEHDGITFRDCRPVQQGCPPNQVSSNGECVYCWDYYGNVPGSSYHEGAGLVCDCAEGYRWRDYISANVGGVVFRHCVPDN